MFFSRILGELGGSKDHKTCSAVYQYSTGHFPMFFKATSHKNKLVSPPRIWSTNTFDMTALIFGAGELAPVLFLSQPIPSGLIWALLAQRRKKVQFENELLLEYFDSFSCALDFSDLWRREAPGTYCRTFWSTLGTKSCDKGPK